jgi:hypothetical protein
MASEVAADAGSVVAPASGVVATEIVVPAGVGVLPAQPSRVTMSRPKMSRPSFSNMVPSLIDIRMLLWIPA